jgi:hypothetical protein
MKKLTGKMKWMMLALPAAVIAGAGVALAAKATDATTHQQGFSRHLCRTVTMLSATDYSII